jgi:uncharacterized protein involved in exopolysaccharide biosynthesis
MLEGLLKPRTVTQRTIRTQWIVAGAVVAVLGGIVLYLAMNRKP